MTTATKMQDADLRARLAIGLIVKGVAHAPPSAIRKAKKFLESETKEARKKAPSTTIPAVGKSVHA